MLRISALNDSSSSEDDYQKIQQTKTKEAKEAEAFAAYNKALSHHQKGNTLHAEKLLRNLFDHPLLKEASSLVDDENQKQTLNHPGLQLLYSIQKNLASILLQRGQLHEAMGAYIEAVKIDSSEVTVWFKMGQVAQDLHNYPLAKICFQQALQCNPNHWPSLDNAITVTYALGDYLMCLENISMALEKDYSYPKGLSLRKQMLSEQPMLESLTKELFVYCDPRIHSTTVGQDEAKEYISEALKIRAKRRQLFQEHQERELRPLTFLKPLTPFTWKNVGEQLIDLYDFAVSSDPPKSLALEVDLRDYFFLDQLAFLGESVTQDKRTAAPPSEIKDVQLSPSKVTKVARDVVENEENSTFQRATKQSDSTPVVPQSLNIRDAARESALMRRIQGDLSHCDVPGAEFSDAVRTNTPPSRPSHLAEELVPDELELEAMDVSDAFPIPLLQEEDINIAVLGLKDFRKAEFRPELLLKENDEDMPDAKSLESVLSSVIDMEMQEMYPKVSTQDQAVKTNSVDGVNSLPETGELEMSVVRETKEPSADSQDKPKAVSVEGSEPGEKPSSLVQTSVSRAHSSTPIVFAVNLPCNIPSEITSLDSLVRGVSASDRVSPILAAHGICSSTPVAHQLLENITTQPGFQANTSPAHAKNQQLLQAQLSPVASEPLHTSHTTQTKSPLHAQPSSVHISPHSTQSEIPLLPHPVSRVDVSPPPAHSIHSQSPLLIHQSTRVDVSPPPAHSVHSQSPLLVHQSTRVDVSPPPAHSVHSESLLLTCLSSRSPPPTETTQRLSPLKSHLSPKTKGLPSLAHTVQAESSLHAISSPSVGVSPPPAHVTQIQSFPYVPLSHRHIDSPQPTQSSAANPEVLAQHIHGQGPEVSKQPIQPSTLSPHFPQVHGTQNSPSSMKISQQTHSIHSSPSPVQISHPALHSSPSPAQISHPVLHSSPVQLLQQTCGIHISTLPLQTSEQAPCSSSSPVHFSDQVHSILPSLVQASEQVLNSSASVFKATEQTLHSSSSPVDQAFHSSPIHTAQQVQAPCSSSSPVQTLEVLHSSSSPFQTSQKLIYTSPGQTPQQAHNLQSSPVKSFEHTHGLLTSPAQQTHSLLTSPAQQTHGLLTSPAQQTHGLLTSPAQQTHGLLTSPAQQTHSLLTSPAQQTHGLLTSPAQQTHGLLTSPAQQTHSLLTSPAQQTHGLLTSPAQQTHSLLTSPAHTSHSSFPSLPKSLTSLATAQTSAVTKPHPSDQPPQYISKLAVLPADCIHSPITASLLSPNSSGSMYHSALSSIEQSNADSSVIKILLDSQSGHKPESKVTPDKSQANEEKLHNVSGSFSHLRRSSPEDFIVDLKSQKDSSRERISQQDKTRHSPQSSRGSPHHSSAQLTPGSAQSSNRSSRQQELMSSQSYSLMKTPLLHHGTSPSIVPLSPAETPTYLPLSYHNSAPELYREQPGSLSVSARHLSSLSLAEAENFLTELKAQKLVDRHQKGLSRSRPPPLSRSSSLPGYFTPGPDVSLPSYLSPPACAISPFFPGGRQSAQFTHQPFNLHTSLISLFHSSAYTPRHPLSPHPDVTSFSYPSPHFSSISQRFTPSHLQISPSTTLLSSVMPQRQPAHTASHPYKHQHESIKTPSRTTTKGHVSEQTPQESRLFKPSSPSKKFTSQHDHHQLQQQQSPKKQAQATSQLQNLARIAHQVPSCDELYAVARDFGSNQKQGITFQAMIESMLTSGRTGSHPGHLPSRADFASSTSEVARKRTQSGTKMSGAGASKRGPKRKVDETGSDDWANPYKRRSTRSRNVRGRKEEKTVDYQELMKKYFPQSLIHLEQETSSEKSEEVELEMDKVDGDDEAVNKDYPEISSLKKLIVSEEDDVKTYVKKCLKGHGILDLMYKFLLNLAQRCDCIWYEEMADIYMKLYERLRKHLTVPTYISSNDDTFTPEGLKDYATIILTWAELCLNRATTESGEKSFVVPSKPGQPDNATLDCLGQFHSEDMLFLLSLAGQHDAFRMSHGEFCVRLYWLKAKQHQLFNEIAEAVDCFEIVSELLGDVASEISSEKSSVRIIVPNVSQDKVISLSEARRQLECLQRCKSLEDTQKLYDEAKYDQVVENLVYTFNEKNLSPKSVLQRERPSQLLLLVNSLFSTKRSSECMQWAEASLHEAVQNYKRVSTVQLRKDWSATLVSLFTTMDRIMDEDETVLGSLSHKNLARLAHDLVTVIEIILDVADAVTEMPIGSVRPWKILYRVLRCEEVNNDKQSSAQDMLDRSDEREDKTDADISLSLVMLRDAHDYLGRHSWCTKDDGLLLLFIMSVVEREMEGKNDDDLEELTPIFEQCVYCLYGHPNKRGRARHLSDHNISPVSLTWERAGPVFHHFAPHSVPEFDSYRTSTVTVDVENLLRRIFALVPEKINPVNCLAVVTDYIEGICNTVPRSPAMTADKDIDPYNISSLLYYLLADFYFKSKEPSSKAVKFYQLDLVLNINRLDSWAGLALAKMSQIEQKLNSTELKIEKPIHKNSEAAMRCFRRAVELDTGSRKLWLEYGSLAYQLHSHASRQIKYQNMFSLCEEVLQLAVSRRTEMLNVAKHSYLQASKCEGDGTEEDWLTFYMMGKVAEKQREDPSIYLEHYKQAALCLHEEKAVYPKKIQFVPRPRLALEALEVFYRIQVCALKLILSGCGHEHLQLLDRYVTDASTGHFARGEEKQQKTTEEEREEVFVLPKPASAAVTPVSSKPQPVYHKNPIDHEYSQYKSASDSQSEGEDSKCQDLAKPRTWNERSDIISGEPKAGERQMTVDGTSVLGVELVNGTEPSSVRKLQSSCAGSAPGVSNAIDSNIPEMVIENRPLSCDNSQDNKSAAPVSASGAWSQQEKSSEEEMETDTSEVACKVKSEASVEMKMEIPHKDGDEGRNENKGDSKLELIPSASYSELACQVTKSGESDLNDSSQDNSQKEYCLSSSQDNSQDSGRGGNKYGNKGDFSEGDAGILSCGSEADVDTDEMDVDDDVISASNQTSQSSVDTFVMSGQVYKSEPAAENFSAVKEIIEIHAGEDFHEVSTVRSSPSDLYRCVSEGFVPSTENHDTDSEKHTDIDTVKGTQEVISKCLESEGATIYQQTRVMKATHDSVFLTEFIDRSQESSKIENAKDNDQTDHSIKSASDEYLQVQTTNESVSIKDALDIPSDQGRDNGKRLYEMSQPLCEPEEVSVNLVTSGDSVSRNIADGAGSLKEEGTIRAENCQKVDDAITKSDEEKCKTEYKEKSDGLTGQLHQPMETSGAIQAENISGMDTVTSDVEKIENEGVSLSQNVSTSRDSFAHIESAKADTREVDIAAHKDPELLRAELLSKCRAGLELCASRFSSHYKSLYRLAHMCYSTKELDKARDLLLGRPDWQEQPHMPAPGLFSERKQNNFFQGLWKIPVEDIDRSGCFASHVHRSVQLLLEVLSDLGDLEMLKNLHNQLRRTPEAGKKYLRDAERLVLAEEAYLKCATVLQQDMEMSDHWSEEQREENLSRVYHVWLAGKGCKHLDRVTDALHRAFKIMMKGRTDVNRLTAAQAISFCQQNLSKPPAVSTPTSAAAPAKSSSQSGAEKSRPTAVPSVERSEMEKPISKQNEPEKQNVKSEDAMETDRPAGLHGVVVSAAGGTQSVAGSNIISVVTPKVSEQAVTGSQSAAGSETVNVASTAIPAVTSQDLPGGPEEDVIILSDSD